jgi:hypothetical protein
MTNALSPRTDTLIERILEFSADAQIKRRETLPASITFHNLTGEILAYGKVLRVLTKAEQDGDEHYLVIKPLQAAASAGRSF